MSVYGKRCNGEYTLLHIIPPTPNTHHHTYITHTVHTDTVPATASSSAKLITMGSSIISDSLLGDRSLHAVMMMIMEMMIDDGDDDSDDDGDDDGDDNSDDEDDDDC